MNNKYEFLTLGELFKRKKMAVAKEEYEIAAEIQKEIYYREKQIEGKHITKREQINEIIEHFDFDLVIKVIKNNKIPNIKLFMDKEYLIAEANLMLNKLWDLPENINENIEVITSNNMIAQRTIIKGVKRLSLRFELTSHRVAY